MTKAQLMARRISSPYELAKLQDEPKVCIVYSPQEMGRAYRPATWRVYRIGYHTDSGAHWTDYGNKTFNCFRPREDKLLQFQAAVAWATEQYGIREWERTPFGSYHPKGTLARVKAMEEA